jgi:hypothetical protein
MNLDLMYLPTYYFTFFQFLSFLALLSIIRIDHECKFDFGTNYVGAGYTVAMALVAWHSGHLVLVQN